MQCQPGNRQLSPSQFSPHQTMQLSAFALNQLPDIVLLIQPDARIFYVNEAACQQLGYDYAELLQFHIFDIAPDVSAGQWSAYWQDLLQKNCILNLEYQTQTKQRLAVEVRLTYITGAGMEYACAIASPPATSTARVSPSPDLLTQNAHLLESVQLYRQILDAIPDMILCKGAGSRVLYGNKAFCDYYGITSADLEGRIGAPHPKSNYTQQYVKDDRYVFRTGQSLLVEEPIIRHDGEEHTFSTIKSPIFDQSGAVIQTVGISRNITNQKEAERKLREQEQFLRSVYDGSEHLIFVVEVLAAEQFRIVGWNPATERVTGLTSREIAGKSPIDVFGEAEGRHVHRNYARCVAAGEVVTYEECRRLQGQDTWWFTTLNPLRDEDGRIIRLVGTTSDITERKRVEAIIHQRAAKLRKHNAILHLLTHQRALSEGDWENAVQAITAAAAGTLRTERVSLWLYDQPHQPQTLLCVDLYQQSSNCHSQEDALNVADFPSYFDALRQERILVAQNTLVDPRLSEFVDCYLKPLGITAMIDSPIRVGGEVVGVLCIEHVGSSRHWEPEDEAFVRSISDLVALAIESRDRKWARAALQQSEQRFRQQTECLQQALAELQRTHAQMVQSEKMSSLGQLVAGVAHEINNPVNFIYGNLTHAKEYIQDLVGLIDLYQQCYPSPLPEIEDEISAIDLDFLKVDLPKLLSSMKVGADRIQQIVTSLRTFSRMDEAEMKAVDIHGGIDSTLMILQNRTKAKPERCAIQVNRHYGDLPLVECYAGQLNQVFMNLISNAIDALDDVMQQQPDFAAAIDIYTEVTATNQATIRICDNGAGIPDEVKQQIFNPFFTTKPIGKGTGMGLSISFQIITEKHGGTLTCRSQPNQGTEFIITIPLHQQVPSS
ncbi:MAG: PAS domain-containing protein [Thainema sp.]